MWHCPHSLLSADRAAIDRYLLTAGPTAPDDGTDGQTDRRAAVSLTLLCEQLPIKLALEMIHVTRKLSMQHFILFLNYRTRQYKTLLFLGLFFYIFPSDLTCFST